MSWIWVWDFCFAGLEAFEKQNNKTKWKSCIHSPCRLITLPTHFLPPFSSFEGPGHSVSSNDQVQERGAWLWLFMWLLQSHFVFKTYNKDEFSSSYWGWEESLIIMRAVPSFWCISMLWMMSIFHNLSWLYPFILLVKCSSLYHMYLLWIHDDDWQMVCILNSLSLLSLSTWKMLSV